MYSFQSFVPATHQLCTPASIQRTAHPTCIHFAAYAPRASQRRTRRATTINLRLSTLAATVLFSRAMAHTGTAGNTPGARSRHATA